MSITDRDIAERVARLFAVAVVDLPKREAHWKDAFLVSLRGGRAIEWMEMLRPLMGERRQEQIDRAIKSWRPVQRGLSQADRLRVAERFAAGESAEKIGKDFGLTKWAIYKIKDRVAAAKVV